MCVCVIKRGKRGATSDGGERLSSPFLWGNGNPQNKRVTLPCPDGLRTSREYKRNEDDDEDDGDFIGNV